VKGKREEKFRNKKKKDGKDKTKDAVWPPLFSLASMGDEEKKNPAPYLICRRAGEGGGEKNSKKKKKKKGGTGPRPIAYDPARTYLQGRTKTTENKKKEAGKGRQTAVRTKTSRLFRHKGTQGKRKKGKIRENELFALNFLSRKERTRTRGGGGRRVERGVAF